MKPNYTNLTRYQRALILSMKAPTPHKPTVEPYGPRRPRTDWLKVTAWFAGITVSWTAIYLLAQVLRAVWNHADAVLAAVMR